MIKTLIISIIFSTVILQANDFKVENLVNSAIQGSSFPYFTSKKYSRSAKNINNMIQYSYFKNY